VCQHVVYMPEPFTFFKLQRHVLDVLTAFLVRQHLPSTKNEIKTFEGLTQGLWELEIAAGGCCNPAKDCVHSHHEMSLTTNTHSNYCHCDMDTRLTIRSAVIRIVKARTNLCVDKEV
jgi:hypothetical protein